MFILLAANDKFTNRYCAIRNALNIVWESAKKKKRTKNIPHLSSMNVEIVSFLVILWTPWVCYSCINRTKNLCKIHIIRNAKKYGWLYDNGTTSKTVDAWRVFESFANHLPMNNKFAENLSSKLCAIVHCFNFYCAFWLSWVARCNFHRYLGISINGWTYC